jgi:hypothetical protein
MTTGSRQAPAGAVVVVEGETDSAGVGETVGRPTAVVVGPPQAASITVSVQIPSRLTTQENPVGRPLVTAQRVLRSGA